MAGITQIVDERIELLRKERSELDALRLSLEEKEADIYQREQEQRNDIDPLVDRKEALHKEIKEATAELERLRTERYSSVESFGDEIDQLHTEKNAAGLAQAKQIHNEIAFMLKGRAELEEELVKLRQDLAELEEKAEREQVRAVEDREAFLTRTRAEREASLKEMNLSHSVAVADMDREKKALENEISALEQTKGIEWNKVQAEISRYKTSQLAELDAQIEQTLAETEKEKARILAELRAEERKHEAEAARERRERDKEIALCKAEKQTIMDEIKLLEFEYERTKAENIVKIEKARTEEHIAQENARAEAIAKLEEDQLLLNAEWKRQAAEERTKHRDSMGASEFALATLESRKSSVVREIEQLEAKFEQMRMENDAALETSRLEKLRAIDEERIKRLQEEEEARKERFQLMEQTFLEKSAAHDLRHSEKMENCRKALDAAGAELESLKEQGRVYIREIETLKRESNKMAEDNKTRMQYGILERQTEMEKLSNEKLAEVDIIVKERLAAADERLKRVQSEAKEAENRSVAKVKADTELLADLRKQISELEPELTRRREAKLSEIQQEVIAATDEFSKLKISKLSEIETYLEEYRKERIEAIQKSLEEREQSGLKSLKELVELNEDYSRRVIKLQEESLALAANERNFQAKERRYADEIDELKKTLESGAESAKLELDLVSKAKDEQIALLESRLENQKDLETQNHAMALRLVELEKQNADTK